jgi:GT2 family glycosyltransferase
MNLLVFTVIVTYNGMRWIERTLKTLSYCTPASSIIIVDNQSRDGTPEFISKYYPGIILLRSPKNVGFGKANNMGIKEALKRKADYVFLLNQDAYIHPDSLDRVVKVHRKHPAYGVLSPIHLDGTGKGFDFGFKNYIDPSIGESLLSNRDSKTENLLDIYPLNFVNAAAWLISRECLEEVGGFDPLFFMYGEDNDYLYRVRQKGFSIGIVTGAYMNHDRLQTDDKKDAPLKKRINWHRSRSLIRLKETGDNRLFNLMLREYAYLWKQLIKSLLKLDLKNTIVFLSLIPRLTLSLPTISCSRKVSRYQRGAFLAR